MIVANYHKGMDNHGQRTMIKIKSNTIGGGQIAEIGDSINFSMPNSKTRRGRVGKKVAQTLDTQVNIGVVVTENYLQWDSSGKGHASQQDRAYYENGATGTLCAGRKMPKILTGCDIRRLTEIECERLQGLKDNHTEYGIYERQVWINKKLKTFEIVYQKHKIPKSQRYMMIGNGVSVIIPETIGVKLLNGLNAVQPVD